MKKAALTAMLAVAIVACAQTAEERAAPQEPPAAPAFNCPDPVVINLKIKAYGVEYPDKDKMNYPAVPGFFRNCYFEVHTNWDEANEGQTLTLKGFKAVDYNPGNNPQWDKVEDRKIEYQGQEMDSVTFTYNTPKWGPYRLPSDTVVGQGRPRLILFTMELKTAGGDMVTFDPPWSEKRRGGGG